MPFQAVVMGGLRTDFSTEYSLNRRLADEFQGAAVLFTARQDLNKVRAPFLEHVRFYDWIGAAKM